MTAGNHIAKLGILNDTDAPHQNAVVVVFDRGGGLRWAFVSPRANHPGDNSYLNPEAFTPLSDFGVKVTLTPDGKLALHQFTISAARYPDGRARHWQGAHACVLDIHPHYAGHVVRAVQAEFSRRRAKQDARAAS